MTQEKRDKRLFGTNVVRGVIGDEMNPTLALAIGMALGTMRQGTIAVGRDTRTSGPALLSALTAGLMATGCDVVDCGILPTPALQYIVRDTFAGGAIITASHNPPEYNGVKVIEPDGTEMGDDETITLEGFVLDHAPTDVAWDRVGRASFQPERVENYCNAVVKAFDPGIGSGMTVVVDPGSGAACATTPDILRRIGCRVLTINAHMDGRFPGRLPEPSAEGLSALSSMVVSAGATFGVAHDGDADRAVFIDNQGRFVEENASFAIIADHICSTTPGDIVTPVSTSRFVEITAAQHHRSVYYTPVGSIYVARTMRKLIASGRVIAFGGEGNGGLIYPSHQFCRDGGMTAAVMVALLHDLDLPLSTIVDALPSLTMRKEKMKVADAQGLMAHLTQHYMAEGPDLTDGIRINRPDAWALIRPSGTEPLVRVIVEAGDAATADHFLLELTEVMSAFISSKPG